MLNKFAEVNQKIEETVVSGYKKIEDGVVGGYKKIEKGVVSGKTSSVARNIDGEERVEEIARMLSGDANTQQSLDHARAMLLKYSGGN